MLDVHHFILTCICIKIPQYDNQYCSKITKLIQCYAIYNTTTINNISLIHAKHSNNFQRQNTVTANNCQLQKLKISTNPQSTHTMYTQPNCWWRFLKGLHNSDSMQQTKFTMHSRFLVQVHKRSHDVVQ